MKLKSNNYFLVSIQWYDIIKDMPLEKVGELCRAFFTIADGENYVSNDVDVNHVLELFKDVNGFR